VTVGFGPLWRIDGPVPTRPTYGLLQAAEAPTAGVRIIPDTDERGIERWMNGVEVYPYLPGTGDVFDTCAAAGTTAHTKGFGNALQSPQFGAFTAHVDETCTSYKVWDQQEFIARATTVFGAVESAIISSEFMTGARLPANPHLSDGVNTTFPNADTATSVLQGLALLENVIATSGRLGLVHCSPGFATIMRERFTVDTKTGVLRSVNGNVVIPDAGYSVGSTPAGHAAPGATQEWIYATGPIDIRRSEMFVTPDNVIQALDRGSGGATTGRSNSITYRAERYYSVTWDTEVHAAVLVDRCKDAFSC